MPHFNGDFLSLKNERFPWKDIPKNLNQNQSIALATKSHRSHQEIALVLGINPSTFRNWMSEAMMSDNSKSNKPAKKSQADLEKELLALQYRR